MSKRKALLTQAGALALVTLNEATSSGDDLHSNVRSRLSDAIRDHFRNTGDWGYYVDHTGDGTDGDVVYSGGGDTKRCNYHLGADSDGKLTSDLDWDGAVSVVPITTYAEESPTGSDDDEAMSSMYEAKLYTDIGTLPLCERFISKKERDAADASDFAGKGKSYPILKPGDVDAAARSIGRAGSGNLSMDAIKRRIIAIAKRKGWEKYLPKSWQDDATDKGATAKEAAKKKHDARVLRVAEAKKKPAMKDCPDCNGTGDCADCDGDGSMQESLREAKTKDCPTCKGTGDCPTCKGEGVVAKEAAAPGAQQQAAPGNTGNATAMKLEESALITASDGKGAIKISEAFKSDYQIKLIAPGLGSSAFYPAEVLKRDGPKFFKAGTHVYINHPTKTEESERPEGNVNNLAAVLAKDAYWLEEHKHGPGLYSTIKPFADHVQTIDEKGPYCGMSIRASGVAEPGVLREGKPVLKEFTGAESVDVVTRAGAGGLIFQESATGANTGEGMLNLTEAQLADKISEAVKLGVAQAMGQTNKPLIERAVRGDATRILEDELRTVALPDAQKAMIRENLDPSRRALPIENDFLNETKFTESVRDEIKRVGKAFAEATGGGRVFGMGESTTHEPTAEEKALIEASKQRNKDLESDDIAIFEALGMPEGAASTAVTGSVSRKKAA